MLRVPGSSTVSHSSPELHTSFLPIMIDRLAIWIQMTNHPQVALHRGMPYQACAWTFLGLKFAAGQNKAFHRQIQLHIKFKRY